MNDEDLDAFLEHHGIKGQKWGIRNKKKKKPLTKAEKTKRNDRRKAIIGKTLGTVGIGLYVAAYISATLRAFGQQSATRPPPGFSRSNPNRAKSVRDLIESERNTQLYSLRRTHKEGHIDKEQLVNFIKVLNKRYDRRLAEAGK